MTNRGFGKMNISKDKWVAIHYTLKGDDGVEIDSSVGKEPLGFVHGRGYLIAGLEKELEGKTAGDKFSTVIAPKDAYGEIDPQLIINVKRDQFDGEVEPGMLFQVMSPQGPIIVRAVEVGPEIVKIDGNHELAGKTLHFDVEVVEVRDATEDELNPPSGCCGGGCGNCGEGGCDGNCSGDGECNCDGGCGNCGN